MEIAKTDVVFCIDGTGDMGVFSDVLKQHIFHFLHKLADRYQLSSAPLEQLRVKAIVFKDFATEDDAMAISPFYTLIGDKDESADFRDLLDNTIYDGGGDIPENSLEALALAMRSDWEKNDPADPFVQKQIIVLYTNTSAVPLKARATNPNYPTDLPADLNELNDLWNTLPKQNKGLFIFAPESVYPWAHFADWDRTCLFPMNTTAYRIPLFTFGEDVVHTMTSLIVGA